MKWVIDFSKSSSKFLDKNNLSENIVISIISDGLMKLSGHKINIDIKKLKGKWKGFHRIRSGKIRIIIKINFQKCTVYTDKIDFRGGVYK